MEKVGIFYGSSTGNTESVANEIQKILGDDIAQLIEVSDANASDLEKFSNLILGSSTWGIGEMQDDFDVFLPQIEDANLEGKKVAIFGCGDQDTYADSFVDAIGIIYETIENKNCDLIGKISTDGYNFDISKAEKDNQLVGLAIDEENQSDLTNERIKNWVDQLKQEFN
ncbi:MAG: flavodoxin [Bacteroidales bacterium]|nr:flavodoxin [Bacteroidales bacterium]